MISDTAFQACRVIYNSFGSFFLKLIKYQLSKKTGFPKGCNSLWSLFWERGEFEGRKPVLSKKMGFLPSKGKK